MVDTHNHSFSGGWRRSIAWTQEAEVGVSGDRSTALQPGQQSEICLKKEKSELKTTLSGSKYRLDITKKEDSKIWDIRELWENFKQ